MRRSTLLLALVTTLALLTFADSASAYYNPTVGRWMTRDPITYQDGLNLYAYGGNSPAARLDPSGQLPGDEYYTNNPSIVSQVAGGVHFATTSSGLGSHLPDPPSAGPADSRILTDNPLTDGNYPVMRDPDIYEPKPTMAASTTPDAAGFRGPVTHQNLGELIQNARNQVSPLNCIGGLEISGHSTPEGMYFGPMRIKDKRTGKKVDAPFNPSNTDIAAATVVVPGNANEVGDELANLPFCCPCKIFLSGCNTGRLAGDQTWPQIIADRTGCTVYGSMGSQVGFLTRGNSTITAEVIDDRRVYESAPGMWRRFVPSKARSSTTASSSSPTPFILRIPGGNG